MAEADKNQSMPHVWSVTELTRALKRTLDATFPLLDLEGEVSGFKLYPSGHAYWTLKDEESQIAAVMFQRELNACACRDRIKDGARLKIRGRVTVGYRSQYQIVALRVKELGVGELMQRYLELKAKLEQEGLFEASRKRPIPRLPRRIGLITSPSGAVVHDLCRVMMRRFPHLEIRIFPAAVQGNSAPATLRDGLDYFNDCPDWRADLIIFGRGGGSFEDLFCFNDEAFVRAVAASKIPTISAVGHETDFTLADFAADLRAGTPSMAAELAVPDVSVWLRTLDRATSSLAASLRSAYEWHAQRLDNRSEALGRALTLYHVKAAAKLTELETKINLLSPYSVLERGYSLTTDAHGRVIRAATDVAPGDKIHTRLHAGELRSVVAENEPPGFLV